MSAKRVSTSKEKLSIRLLKQKSVSAFTVSARTKLSRGLEIRGINTYVSWKKNSSLVNIANQFFWGGFLNNFLYVLLAHFSLLFVFLRYYAIWQNIYKAHSLLRLQGVSILSVSAPTIFSVFSLLEIESVSILTVSAPTENFSFYLLAWPHCISSRVCHLPQKNV